MSEIFINVELPNTWTWAKSKEIGLVINGDRGKNYPSRQHYIASGVPFLSAGNLDEGKIDKSSLNYISEEKYNALNNGKLQKGDIIYCLRGTLGKCAAFDLEGKAAIASSLAILRPSQLINKKYLLYFLQGPFGSKLIKHFDNGTAQPNLSGESFSNYDFPIAPLPEQHRIVAKIEKLFSELDKGIVSLKTAQQQLKVYRQAVLKYAFEGKLTNPDVKEGELPEGWEIKSLNQFCKVETGTTPPKTTPEYYKDGNVPFYKPTDLEANANVNQSREYVSELGMNKARYVPEGSTLVTCIGATIGKTGLLTKGGVFNQQINAMMPFNHIVPKYLYYQTISPSFQEQIKLNASATTLPILNKGKFVELKMYICDPNEQQFIVQEIESRLSVCDKIEESITQGLAQAEALRQSILKKAFEGKLVPQDPSDEPASVLLERIRAERAAAQPEKRKRVNT